MTQTIDIHSSFINFRATEHSNFENQILKSAIFPGKKVQQISQYWLESILSRHWQAKNVHWRNQWRMEG